MNYNKSTIFIVARLFASGIILLTFFSATYFVIAASPFSYKKAFLLSAILLLLLLFFAFYFIAKNVIKYYKITPNKLLADVVNAMVNENYFAKIFEHSNDAIIAADIHNRVKAWNKAAEKMFGYTLAEVLGKPVSNILIIEDEIRKAFRSAVNQNGQWQGEVDIINRNGKLLKTIFSASSIKNEKGIITDYISTIKDVTEKGGLQDDLGKLNLSLLQQVEDKTILISEILGRLSDGFAAFDSTLNITYVNSYLEELVNIPASALIGINAVKDHIELPGIVILEEVFKSQHKFQTEIFSKPFDKWFSISYYPSTNGISVYLRDITKKKEIQQQLENVQLQNRNLIENAKDVIGIVNEKGEILKVNASIETMFGYTREEAQSMSLNDFLFPENKIDNPFNLSRVPTEGFLSNERKYRKKDGTKVYAEVITSRLPDGTFMGILRDITERRKQGKEIEKFKKIIENSPALVGTMSMDANITYINKATRNAIDIGENEDVSHINGFSFFKNKITPLEVVMGEVMNKGYWEGENTLIGRSGKETPILQVVLLHRNQKREPAFISSNAIDISDLKIKQDIIYKERDFLLTLINNLPGIFYMFRPDGHLYKWNKNFGLLLGYSDEELKTMNSSDFYDPQEKEFMKDRFQKTFIGQAPPAAEVKFLTKYHKKIPLMVNSWCIDYKNEPILVGIGFDLSDLKAKEQTVNKLNLLIKNSVTFVAITDIKTKKILFINSSFRNKLEADPDEEISFDKFHTHEEYVFFKEIILPNIFQKGRWSGEYSFRSRTNKKIVVLGEWILHNDEEGNPNEISVTAIDISILKEKENELNRLAGIIENTNALVIIVDLNFRVLYFNEAAKERLGIGKDEDITLLSGYDFIPNETKERMKQEEAKLYAEGKCVGELTINTRSGEIFPVLEVAIIHKDETGLPQYFSFTFLDISESKQKETELKNLTSIIENSPAYITMADLNKNYLYANTAFKEAFGIGDDEDITKLNVAEIRGPSTLEIIKNGNEEFLTNGKWTGTNSFVSRNGKEIPVLQVLVLHKDNKGVPDRISFTAIDLTEQKEKEKEILKLNNELRQLSVHLQDIAEKERSELAKEIHDEFGQNLAALRLNAAWLKTNIKDKSLKVEERLNEQLSISEDAINTSRAIYNSLHPSMLDEIGLESAIQWHTKTFLKSSNIISSIHANIEYEKFSKEINLGLFRIFQDSLTNVVLHSNATRVVIDIYKMNGTLIMRVKDNGIGFDVNNVNIMSSHGLLIMRERAYAMSGSISIISTSENGTQLEVRVPLLMPQEGPDQTDIASLAI
jgi:PAS domain S-box-containing protein